jgi:hypothetical protein
MTAFYPHHERDRADTTTCHSRRRAVSHDSMREVPHAYVGEVCVSDEVALEA